MIIIFVRYNYKKKLQVFNDKLEIKKFLQA